MDLFKTFERSVLMNFVVLTFELSVLFWTLAYFERRAYAHRKCPHSIERVLSYLITRFSSEGNAKAIGPSER